LNRLIKNELAKIFKKKSIYITLLVILAFVILTNCIYKFFYHSGSYQEYNDNYIQYVKEELAKLDQNKASDTKMYIDLQSQVEVYDMRKKYEKDAWQRNIITKQMSSYITEKNTYLYGEEKDEEKVKDIQEKIQKMIERLEQDDWRYFAQEELEQILISTEKKITAKNKEKEGNLEEIFMQVTGGEQK